MKTNYSFIFSFIIFFVLSATIANSQTKLIITSKQNIQQLQLKNLNTSEVSQIPTWNKSGGGFLIECNDLANTQLISSGMAVFKILNMANKQTTEWIGLQENESITFAECFKKYPGPTLNEGDAAQNASAFFSSSYSGYSVSESNTMMRATKSKNASLVFQPQNKKVLFTGEDLAIKWEAKAPITNISIRDLTSPAILWMAPKYNKNYITYHEIKEKLNNKYFEQGHKYQLKIQLDNSKNDLEDGGTHSYNFELKSFVFQNEAPSSFLTIDSVSFSWKTNQKVEKISIKDIDANKVIWETNRFSKNILTINDIYTKKTKDLLEARKKYRLEVRLEQEKKRKGKKSTILQEQVATMDFEIILNDSEFLEFMKFINQK